MKWKPYPKYKASGAHWVADVPADWDVVPLAYLVRLLGGATPDTSKTEYWDGTIPWVSPKDMKVAKIADAEDHVSFEALQNSPLQMIPADTVLFVVRGMILAHSFPVAVTTAPVTINQDMKGAVCGERLLPRFLAWALDGLEGLLVSLADESAHGTRKLETGTITRLPFLLPPRTAQHAISDFLDRETTRIDALVAKKRTLIERLKEKRTALISRTVTRGLPPEAARAAGLDPHPKLKPSGIDWLGDVPAHWHVLPLTKYIAEKSDYRGKTPEKTEEGVFLVTAKNVRMGFIDYESSREYVAEVEYDEIMRRGLPKIDDILFTTEAPLGNVALVDREDIALAQRIIRFRMHPAVFDSKFTLYAMMSDHFQVQLQGLSTGSTAEGLKASKLPLLRLIAPPVSEQRAIAEFLDRETANVDELLTKVASAIERLQEYRTALITAAVTGKIDVRHAAG